MKNVSESVLTWIRAYSVTLKTKKSYQVRLKELLTWDNCNGHVQERQDKIEALRLLLGISVI